MGSKVISSKTITRQWKMCIVFSGMIGIFFLLACITGCGREDTWEKQIVEEEIIIDGLSGKYELLFLTDNHMIVEDEEDSEQVAEYAVSRLDVFRNGESITSAEQFEEWVAYAHEENVDGVLLGGDIIDYPSESNIAYLKEMLQKLDMPYVYTLGNHDWTYPWEYMTDYGKSTYRPLFEPYMQGNCAVHVRDFGEFQVVAVDNSSNQIDEAALQECEKILSEDKPVIVLMHVPFFTQTLLEKAKAAWSSPVVIGGGAWGGIYPNEATTEFMKLITAKDSPVQAVIAGHVHFYHKDYIEGEKKVLQIVGNAGAKGSATLLHVHGKSYLTEESEK